MSCKRNSKCSGNDVMSARLSESMSVFNTNILHLADQNNKSNEEIKKLKTEMKRLITDKNQNMQTNNSNAESSDSERKYLKSQIHLILQNNNNNTQQYNEVITALLNDLRNQRDKTKNSDLEIEELKSGMHALEHKLSNKILEITKIITHYANNQTILNQNIEHCLCVANNTKENFETIDKNLNFHEKCFTQLTNRTSNNENNLSEIERFVEHHNKEIYDHVRSLVSEQSLKHEADYDCVQRDFSMIFEQIHNFLSGGCTEQNAIEISQKIKHYMGNKN